MTQGLADLMDNFSLLGGVFFFFLVGPRAGVKKKFVRFEVRRLQCGEGDKTIRAIRPSVIARGCCAPCNYYLHSNNRASDLQNINFLRRRKIKFH